MEERLGSYIDQILMVIKTYHFVILLLVPLFNYVTVFSFFFVTLQYEDPVRQEAARKTVPIDKLEEKALVAIAKKVGHFFTF